jgi:hypothetical protein
MTINIADNTPRVSYTVAQGVTQTSFTVSFEFFAEADLNVYVDGTLKTLTTDYTVSGGDGSTGTITMSVTGAAGGSTVVITRDIEFERVTDFPPSGAFEINALNTELDRLTAICADLNDEITRSLRLTDYDAGANLTLPDLASRAGKVLAFDAVTGDLVNGPSTAGVTTIAAAAADIATLADIEDGTVATDAISDTAAIASDVTTVSGIAANVTTTAGISANVTSVSGNATNINTVAANDANITTVAGIDSDVTTAAGIASNITTVAGEISPTNNISTVAGKATEISNLGTTQAVADMNALATAPVLADMSTLADIATDITTVAHLEDGTTATDAISDLAAIATDITAVAAIQQDIQDVQDEIANLQTVANDLNEATSEIETVAASIANVDLVGADITNVNTVASNLTNVNAFADTYFVSATAPSSPTEGDLWFDTANDIMKVYDGSGFVNAGSSVNGTSERNTYTATAGQTSFAATYDAGYVDVYLNGIKLIDGTDFTATSGTSVVLASGAALNDTVDIVAYGTFELLNTELNDLSDVNTSGVSSGDVLTYNGSVFAPSAPTVYTLSSLGIANHDDITVDASSNVTLSNDLTVDTSTLKVDSTNNRVGIGTASPANPLHVTASLTGNDLVYLNNINPTASDVLRLNTAGNGSGTNVLDVQSSDTSRFIVRGDGITQIGSAVGDSSTSGVLHVGGFSYFTNDLRVVNNVGNDPQYTNSSSPTGVELTESGFLVMVANSTAGGRLCRTGTDGAIIYFYAQGNIEGNISVSGTTSR